MQYYRCKCGKSEYWTSMGVPSCASCEDCGSDFAQGPSGHEEPKPHRFVTRYDQNTGKPYEICDLCMKRKSELGDKKLGAEQECG